MVPRLTSLLSAACLQLDLLVERWEATGLIAALEGRKKVGGGLNLPLKRYLPPPLC